MKPADRTEFAALILAAAEMKQQRPSEAALEMYWEVLRDLPLEDFKRGLYATLRDPERGRFMPVPADILHFARPQKTSLVAWKEVEDAIFRFGVYQSVQFADQVTNAVLHDMGGWIWINQQNLEDPWTQREFERRYNDYRLQEIRSTDRLIGFFELDNGNKNLPEWIPKTITIGEAGAARQLPSGGHKKLTDGAK